MEDEEDQEWKVEVADPRAVLGRTANNLFMEELDEVPEQVVVTVNASSAEAVAYFGDGRTRTFWLFALLTLDVEATQDMPYQIQLDRNSPQQDDDPGVG